MFTQVHHSKHMATFFVLSKPPSHPIASFGAPPSPLSPPLRYPFRRKPRGSTVATRAGPNTSSYMFAFALPLSLLAVTVFTSIRIADKLDQDFLEEMAMNEALTEVDEEDDEDDTETYLQEEPSLPRARNRPKREA